MQIRYNGKYCWSMQPRGHASWCYLRVFQAGEPGSWLADPNQRAIAIMSYAPDNFGTGIARGIEDLAAQIADMFRLNPAHTTFIEHTPPESLMPEYEPLPDEDPIRELERLTSSVFGSTEEKYERVSVAHSAIEYIRGNDPRAVVRGPTWEPITPIEVMRLVRQLDECSV